MLSRRGTFLVDADRWEPRPCVYSIPVPSPDRVTAVRGRISDRRFVSADEVAETKQQPEIHLCYL